MKNFKFIGLSMMILAAAACSEPAETKKEPVLQPIKSVIAMDGKTEVTAKIDHLEKTIKFDSFVNIDDMSAVEVKIEVAEGATLVSPAAVATVDLSKETKVVVNNNVKDLEYVMTADKPSLNPIREAGFEVSDQFGPFPEYMKLYVNKKLGAAKNVTGWLVEVNKGASFSVLGAGSSSEKTIHQIADENKDWIVYLNGICGSGGAIVREGKYVYSSSAIYTAFAVEKDGTFTIKPQKRHILDDGTKKLFKYDYTGKTILDEAWLPTVLFGGTQMIVADGRALTLEEIKKTDGARPEENKFGENIGWWDNDALSGREFLGVNKAGDKAYFFVNGKANEGLSMKEVRNIMLSCGAYDVMTVQGSSSANMLIRGNKVLPENAGDKKTSNVLVIK